MKFWIGLLIMVQVLFMALPAGAEISSNTRMLQKPEWDGATISGMWFYGEFRYQKFQTGNEDINTLSLGPTFAASLPNLPQLELGSRLWLIHADYDHFEDEFGISDIDCWGKYQFYNKNKLLLSGGLMMSLPVGDDGINHPRATGELNFDLFSAARYHVSDQLAIVGHIGLRRNGDMEYDLKGRHYYLPDQKGEFDGETQIEFGGGIIYQLQHNINFLSEFNIATKAYDENSSDTELTGGIEYFLRPNLSIKGGIGLGWDDGAPDAELISGCAFSF